MKILVIGSRAEADAAFDPSLPRTMFEVVAPGAQIPAMKFDAVALPGSLMCADDAGGLDGPSASPEQVLRLAHSALRPGGVVVGHIDHLLSAHGLRNTLQGRVGLGSWLRYRGLISGRRCRQTLLRSGFAVPECFYVEPQIEAPMAVVPVHPLAAKSHFLRSIRRTRGQYSMTGFALRMALAGARLGGILQPDLFFWAQRPC